MSTAPVFEMRFEPMTIEHLGLRLYSTLPPVLSELVSNAYDADSPKVEIVLPRGSIDPQSEVVVRDYGHGMSAPELADEYLPIGRNRRGDEEDEVHSKGGGRLVTGRKGLGKLSAFGIAGQMEVRAIQGGEAWALILDYQEMKNWASNPNSAASPYRPEINDDRTGPTDEPDGLEVTLRGLRRTKAISIDQVRKGIAKRLVAIGPDFRVLVNGDEIQPKDRVQRSDCEPGLIWDVKDSPVGDTLPESQKPISGWVGFVPKTSAASRGIDIYAHSKAAELSTFFGMPSTHSQFARAYLVGELRADFLDEDEDLVSTARDSIVWETPIGQELKTWGVELLKWAFSQWLEDRRKKKETSIVQDSDFEAWLQTRTSGERKIASKMLRLLAKDDELTPESASSLLEIIKGSIEHVHFNDLVDAIGSGAASSARLLELFAEWRVLEARNLLKRSDGRRNALRRLQEFIDTGAHEVQELQPLLVDNIWLFNRNWAEVDVQPTYTAALRKRCKEPVNTLEKDRRLDIFGVTAGSARLTVVELKHPTKTLSRLDLEQIESYVDWATTEFARATSEESIQSVEGLLLVGTMNRNADVHQKVERLRRSGIYVETYSELYTAAKKEYEDAKTFHRSRVPELNLTDKAGQGE